MFVWCWFVFVLFYFLLVRVREDTPCYTLTVDSVECAVVGCEEGSSDQQMV